MNVLSLSKQVQIISALCEGIGQRAVARLTDTDRKTVARLALRVGRGCAELHDRMMVGVRTNRLELDELWAYVQRRRRQHQAPGTDGPVTGDQYTYVAMSASSRAIISYLTGKRNGENTDAFIRDIRNRVVGTPEFSTDGWHPYKLSIRDNFGNRAPHGVIVKTYSVTHLAVKEAARRYSPAEVVAVARDVVSGVPSQISTSYVERSHLTLRQSSKRFSRLGNGFSKRLEPHRAAVSLYVCYYNLTRTHESLKCTPAMALGLTDRVWTIPDLIEAALATQPIAPVPSAPQRRKAFRVIEGGKS
jgi:IS1 family transposase